MVWCVDRGVVGCREPRLGSKLILVLGHTKCGAIAGATQTFQAGGEKAPGSALEGGKKGPMRLGFALLCFALLAS